MGYYALAVLFFATGIYSLVDSDHDVEVAVVCFLIAIGSVAMKFYRDKHPKVVQTAPISKPQVQEPVSKPAPKVKNNSTDDSIKRAPHSLTFNVAGVTYECKYPGMCETRQEVLEYCYKGDTCHLKEFEWNGKPAFAIIHDRTKCDIGVVPATHTMKVKAMVEKYDVVGTIVEAEEFDASDDGSGKMIIYCEVNLKGIKKEQ